MQTYFIKDKEYLLHYTIGRMEQLEKILGNAITGVMVSITNGNIQRFRSFARCLLTACQMTEGIMPLSRRLWNLLSSRCRMLDMVHCLQQHWNRFKRTAVFYSGKAGGMGIFSDQ